jgi:hypothetical protein
LEHIGVVGRIMLSRISRCDYRRVIDWKIGFIDHLYAPLGTTGNYSAIADLDTLEITTALPKPFPACCVFTNRSLTMASNNKYSSASRSHIVPSLTLVQDCLPATFSSKLCYDRRSAGQSVLE